MKILLIMVALFAYLPQVQAQEMFDLYETQARQYAASTGQPYELCLRALKIAAWCKANPEGGVVNGYTYDAQATAAQLAEATRILTPKQAAQPTTPAAPATIATPPVGSNGLSNRPKVLVGRSANDPQRMAEQQARLQRQNMYQGGNGALPRTQRVIIEGNFSGFAGNSSFRMPNGITWQQTDGVVTQQYPVVVNPTAVITMNADGSTAFLEIVGVPGSVRGTLLR